MLLKVGQVITNPTASAFRPLAHSIKLVRRIAPLTPALTKRAFTIESIKRTQENVINQIDSISPTSTSQTQKPTSNNTRSPLETLEEFRNKGNYRGAIKAVQHAQESGTATPELYIALVNILRELPMNVNESATVAHWFYSALDSKLPKEVVEDLNVWKNVLKLGFRFGSTYRREDLRALVDRFAEIFDLTTLDDQEAWELLMRAYGIMNKNESISACIQKYADNPNVSASFYHSVLLSYAATGSQEDIDQLVQKMKEKDMLSCHVLLRLIRCFGFNGDIERTKRYMDLCHQLYPEQAFDKTMLLIAHKVSLAKICKELEKVRGSRGLPLKPKNNLGTLDNLHKSWKELTVDMFEDKSGKVVDITDCNIVLEYLTLANRIDPVGFPMKKAEEIFDRYMPANYITPNDASYRIMLVGYATSQQYNKNDSNVRLDKALEVVSKMQTAGIDTLNHPTFHSLFRACLPHRNGHYYFDNFRLNSLLPTRPYTHNHFKLNPRIFEIEKIMLEAKLPHDRFTFSTLMTCLAAGKQFKALRSRWRMLKPHGLRRDVGLYRLAFSLSSLNPGQSQHAIVVVRNEMEREIPEHSVNWETYVAMLDCCITAQLPIEAKEIMEKMRKGATHAHKIKKHADDLVKWPFLDSPNFYLPLLRASVAIPGLNTDKILNEMDSKNVVYSQGVWEAVLSKYALEGDIESIRRLFNKYTMTRFEKEGKIPVPVRENSSPTIPFPTAPYTRLDMQFIDTYICSLLDTQDISLIFDVLRLLSEQTDKIGISHQSIRGIVKLAKQEKTPSQDLKWLSEDILPKIADQNKSMRLLKRGIDLVI